MRLPLFNLKIYAIIILIFVFYIGLFFISNLVSERQHYQQNFLQDISQSQISEQSIVSPYIRIPFELKKICTNEKKENYDCIETQWTYIGAKNTDWRGQFNVSNNTYKRSIYRATSYDADFNAIGEFAKENLSVQNYLWNKAEIVFPIRDARGLKSKPTMQIGTTTYQFDFTKQNKEKNGFDFMSISAEQHPELITAIQNGFKFNAQLNLSGLSKFTLIPTSDAFVYQSQGNWADIKYDGQILPFQKQSKEQQFSAKWNNIALGQSNLETFTSCKDTQCFKNFSQGLLSTDSEYAEKNQKIGATTEFIESADIYTQTDRAIKYGIVIIIISFISFFLFEVLKGLRIHPIQYSLVAIAQGLFFVLLLSISEYYAFTWAYFIAAVACISLISSYLYFVMQGLKPAVLFSLILSALYAMVYLLLGSSGKTFLIGSIISFLLLAVVMYITRSIDWYELSNKQEGSQMKVEN